MEAKDQHEHDDSDCSDVCSECEAENATIDAVQDHHVLTKVFASDTPCLPTRASASANPNKITPRERILYLIRHGEARHNIVEKSAMERARSNSLTQGYGPKSPETLRKMEQARQMAINDAKLTNCPLSDRGRNEAAAAKTLLDKLIKENNLPPPTEILVSPLQRAKQTAKIVFPDHGNVRIRKEVRERLTGKPCDTKSPSWERRRRNSLRDLMHGSSDVGIDDRRLSMSKLASYLKKEGSIVEEDNEMVRERIRTKLSALIEESEHTSIALVSHKGFFRELERGPFGGSDAKEFGNGEVRVYRIRFAFTDEENSTSVEVDEAERIA